MWQEVKLKTMAEFGDPDVQEELEAMAGASKVIFSGANRMTSKYLIFLLDFIELW